MVDGEEICEVGTVEGVGETSLTRSEDGEMAIGGVAAGEGVSKGEGEDGVEERAEGEL